MLPLRLFLLLPVILLFVFIGISVHLAKKLSESDFLLEESQKNSSFATPRQRFLGLLALGGLMFLWIRFGSLDQAFRETGKPLALPDQRSSQSPTRSGWVTVDGVRWRFLSGKDSDGAGYQGWVPDSAFQPVPPTPVNAGWLDEVFRKIGLPTMSERIEGVRSLKKINKSLKNALKNP